ncbi:aspartate carbamoyltransferase [Candidatus Pacearchaeota archaeon]|nr:aspartate carbamoyltransferase [Candidatus Pacearchaeota archaeon]
MPEKLNHFVESQQLTPSIIDYLFKRADELRPGPHTYLQGKILALLFYEPSTRTRMSFETAMSRMGGTYSSTENAEEFSSAVKGESLEDTIRVVSKYANCVVIRHKEEGSAAIAAELSKVPVINAGDGKGQHPTQALLDIYTINKEIGRLNDFKIAMVGDLKKGRTVRSLAYLLGKFKGIEITFVSPEHLRIGNDIKAYLVRHNISFSEEDDLNKVIPKMDIIYMTRTQKERMSEEERKNHEDYEKKGKVFAITTDNFNLVRNDARILHPLPKVDEINLPIETEEKDPRIAYFRQVENGLYIRMALLDMLINSS